MRGRLFFVVLAALCLLPPGCSDSPPPAARGRALRGGGGGEPESGRPRPGAGGASLFRLPALDGRPVTVKTPAALYFFTTWCQYCRQAFPDIQAAAERARSGGWRVYGIDVAERPDIVAGYVQRYQPRYPVILDRDGVVANQYKVTGYPTFVLIDANADIVYHGHSVPADF